MTLPWALCVLFLPITHIDQTLAFGVSRVETLKQRLRRSPPPPTLQLDKYLSYDGMLDYMEQMAGAYNERVTLRDLGETYENRKLKSITITNGDGRSGKQVIFLVANEHAREWLTSVAALYVVEQLVVNYEQNSHLLHDYDWILIPMNNPDGYTYSITVDKYWRNTRSPNGRDCYGTNLNRNYDIGWGKGYPELLDACSDHYAGRAPFSEVEARVVRDIMVELVEAKRGLLFLSLHTHHSSIIFPWIYKSDSASTEAELLRVGQVASHSLRRATGKDYGVYQEGKSAAFGGTSIDYAYMLGFRLSYALELTGYLKEEQFDFWPPERLLSQLAEESWIGISSLAEESMRVHISSRAASPTNILKILLLLTTITVLCK